MNKGLCYTLAKTFLHSVKVDYVVVFYILLFNEKI